MHELLHQHNHTAFGSGPHLYTGTSAVPAHLEPVPILSARWHRYSLPLQKPLTTGQGRPVREGFLLTLTLQAGKRQAVGVGEIAPLPGEPGKTTRKVPCITELAGLMVAVCLQSLQDHTGFCQVQLVVRHVFMQQANTDVCCSSVEVPCRAALWEH